MSEPIVRRHIPDDAGGGGGRVATIFAAEFLGSLGMNLLAVGIFFYTSSRFNWTLKQNFMLAVGQGATYAVLALLAGRVSARFGRRASLTVVNLVMAALSGAALFTDSPALVAALLLAYSGLSALVWPMLESLVSAGLDARALSRRVGQYNLVWAGAGPIIIAVSGTLITHFPMGFFLLPVLFHVAAALLLGTRRDLEPPPGKISDHASHLAPHPSLLRKRTVALWLSRIALPSTYVIAYALMAMMPSLPVMERLSPVTQTLVGSTWLGARWVAFLLLGASVWWHARPRVMLVAAGAMLISFLGTTIAPSALLGQWAQVADVASMVAWQIALGLSMGMIYAASLYFGMVLSDGSTAHGGYHEALIGLGSVLGPGMGALAQVACPGNVNAGIAAVGGVVALSVVAAAAASWRLRAPEEVLPTGGSGLPDQAAGH